MAATQKPVSSALPPAPTPGAAQPVRVGLLDLHDWLETHGLTVVGRADAANGGFVVLLAPRNAPADAEATR